MNIFLERGGRFSDFVIKERWTLCRLCHQRKVDISSKRGVHCSGCVIEEKGGQCSDCHQREVDIVQAVSLKKKGGHFIREVDIVQTVSSKMTMHAFFFLMVLSKIVSHFFRHFDQREMDISSNRGGHFTGKMHTIRNSILSPFSPYIKVVLHNNIIKLRRLFSLLAVYSLFSLCRPNIYFICFFKALQDRM